MTAYLTPAQLRALANTIDGLPVEVCRADLDLGDDSTLADEHEAAG